MLFPSTPITICNCFETDVRLLGAVPVTRSHKANDRDHAGLADGTAEPEQHLPRYFAKSGHADADPNKTKKGGSGKGNWYVTVLYTVHPEMPLFFHLSTLTWPF